MSHSDEQFSFNFEPSCNNDSRKRKKSSRNDSLESPKPKKRRLFTGYEIRNDLTNIEIDIDPEIEALLNDEEDIRNKNKKKNKNKNKHKNKRGNRGSKKKRKQRRENRENTENNIENIISSISNNINIENMIKNQIKPMIEPIIETLKKHEIILENIKNMEDDKIESNEERKKIICHKLNELKNKLKMVENEIKTTNKNVEKDKKKQSKLNKKLNERIVKIRIDQKVHTLPNNINEVLLQIYSKYDEERTFRYNGTNRNYTNRIFKNMKKIFPQNNGSQKIFGQIAKYDGSLDANNKIPNYYYFKTKKNTEIMDVSFYNDGDWTPFECDRIISEWESWPDWNAQNIDFYQIWRHSRSGEWRINHGIQQIVVPNICDWNLRMIIKYKLIR